MYKYIDASSSSQKENTDILYKSLLFQKNKNSNKP